MNSDGANQLLDRSKAKFKEGDSASAIRMVNKSIRMHKTPEAEAWLAFLDKNVAPSSSTSSTPSSNDLRHRKTTTSAKTPAEPAATRPYTPEQVVEVILLTIL
jgi:hypothetical protein